MKKTTPSEPATIRPAGPGDGKLLHEMIRALARDLGSEKRARSRPEDLEAALAGRCPAIEALIAERDDRAVGLCVYFASFSTWRGEPGVYVQDIWVEADERGGGLAQRLIAETVRRCGARGARYLRLSVDRDNRPARSFYARIGLGHTARECIYMAAGPAFEALEGIDGKGSSPRAAR